MRSTGVVRCYNSDKGYGFITPDDGRDDLFFSHTAVLSKELGIFMKKCLLPVEFTVVSREGWDCADDVVVLMDKGRSTSTTTYTRFSDPDCCFNCGEMGHKWRECDCEGDDHNDGDVFSCSSEFVHLSRDCCGVDSDNAISNGVDGEVRCNDCGEYGHSAWDCDFSNRASASSTNSSQTATVGSDGNGGCSGDDLRGCFISGQSGLRVNTSDNACGGGGGECRIALKNDGQEKVLYTNEARGFSVEYSEGSILIRYW